MKKLTILTILSFCFITFFHQTLSAMPTIMFGNPSLSIGVIGDSNSDEYRADDNRSGGTEYENNTLNWIEQIALKRDVYFGWWNDSDQGEPRRKGLEYNWARSGATSQSLLDQGQHTGLAEQISQGKISIAIIAIGSNDFAPYNDGRYESIYNEELSGDQLDAEIQQILQNIETAITTLKDASQTKIIIANIMNWNLHPYILNHYPEEDGREKVYSAIQKVNDGINSLAQEYDLLINDLDTLAQNIFSSANNQNQISFGEELINLSSFGAEPHNGFLNDFIHMGTIMEGIIANSFIELINETSSEKIETLSQKEILSIAGIEYLDGDLNHDNQVNQQDLIMASEYFNQETISEQTRSFDLNQDGLINIFDLILIKKNF